MHFVAIQNKDGSWKVVALFNDLRLATAFVIMCALKAASPDKAYQVFSYDVDGDHMGW
jgi:hypothetical protein